MANVLSHDMQKNVWRAYRARLSIITSLAAIVVAIIAALSFVPSFIALRFEEQSLRAVDGTSPADSQIANDRLSLQRAQSLFSQMSPIVSSTSSAPYEAISLALSHRPPNVHIDQVTYTPGITGTIAISGIGASGDDINTYRTALASEARFASVSVPVSSLVGSENGQFTMTLLGAF